MCLYMLYMLLIIDSIFILIILFGQHQYCHYHHHEQHTPHHQNQTSETKSRAIWFLDARPRFKKNNSSSDFQTAISSSYGLLFASNFFCFGVEFRDLHIGLGGFSSLFLSFSATPKSQFLPLQMLGTGSSGLQIRFHFFLKCIFWSTF